MSLRMSSGENADLTSAAMEVYGRDDLTLAQQNDRIDQIMQSNQDRAPNPEEAEKITLQIMQSVE